MELGKRLLNDGRELTLYANPFNYRLCIGAPGAMVYDDFYCFADTVAAVTALRCWDGQNDPEGWVRHGASARRRPDGDPAQEYVAR